MLYVRDLKQKECLIKWLNKVETILYHEALNKDMTMNKFSFDFCYF
jgi:hypothetical protein